MRITSDSGTVRLNLTSARIAHPVIDIELAVDIGTIVITLPRGTSANVDALTTREGTVRSRVAAASPRGAVHLRVSGHVTLGTVKLRYGLPRCRTDPGRVRLPEHPADGLPLRSALWQARPQSRHR